MRVRQVDSIFNLLKGSHFLGSGTTGFCFLLPTGEVIKIYFESERKKRLFSKYENDLIDFFEYISSFNSETFYGPNELIIKDGQVIGYIKNLSCGKTIDHMSGSLTINDIEEMITVLIRDIKLASKKDLRLRDMHQRNIMYSYIFKIIDLDDCSHNDYLKYDDVVKFNMRDLLFVITKSLFKVRDSYDVYFKDPKLDALFEKAVYQDYEEYFNFLEYLQSFGNNLGDLRSAGIHYTLKHVEEY